MEVIFDKNNIRVKGVECLDLDLTLDCGQAFRWEKQEDGSYSGVAGGYFLNVYKDADVLVFRDTDKAAFEFWKSYFDLEKDYVSICNSLKEDELLRS
ncbi:MAG: 8-oxoguanine DNA glycosylase, partial [Eubacterium sp.]|nr:8-oxoguanine DNA glycosylase [Eubacterium sp.]